MLNEFCLTTGYHRKYAIRILNGPAPGKGPARPVRKRGLSYGHELLSVLTSVWEAAGYPWSARLKALLPAWMPWIRKRFKLSPVIEKQLLSISPRQMDRRLAAKKNQHKRRIYGRTKPGYLLKHHIPVKTDNWDVTVSRLHRSRFGLAFRKFERRRVRLFAEHHRHSNHLDGNAGPAGEGANRCPAGPG